MNIEGTYTVAGSPTQLWQCMLDRQVLLQTLPGIEHIEQLDQESYAITLSIAAAPLQGRYQGRVTLSELHYPYHYRISVEGEGPQGRISGAGSIHLHEQQGTTIIAYTGTLTIGKAGGFKSSSTLLKGAAKLLIQQFFTALAEQLTSPGTDTRVGGEIILVTSTLPERGNQPSERTIFASIVRLLRLGGGDPQQIARWEVRLRRASTLTGLLFLVWVGTRLPRRR